MRDAVAIQAISSEVNCLVISVVSHTVEVYVAKSVILTTTCLVLVVVLSDSCCDTVDVEVSTDKVVDIEDSVTVLVIGSGVEGSLCTSEDVMVEISVDVVMDLVVTVGIGAACVVISRVVPSSVSVMVKV